MLPFVAGGPGEPPQPQAAGGRYTELVLPGCGHSPHLERPAEFAAAVTGFLAGVPAP